MGAKTYVGVAALSVVRTISGGYANVFAGDLVPADITEADRNRLLGEGFLGEGPDLPDEEDAATDDGKPTTIKDILAAVGDDKVLAQQYLDEENAADSPRSSLVEKLTAVAEA